MSLPTADELNEILDSRTRRAIRKIVDQVKADAAANKTAFDAHVHRVNAAAVGSTYSSAPATGTAAVTAITAKTWTNNLA